MLRLKTALKVLLALIITGLLALSIIVAVFFRLYPIHTGSMTPALAMKSLIFVREGPYHKGDVITFHHRTITGGDEVITHRFIARDKNGLIITKGDANPSPDAWPVKDQDVIGKVVRCVPQAGYWLVYLKSPTGLGSFLLLGVAFWLLWPELRRKRTTGTQ